MKKLIFSFLFVSAISFGAYYFYHYSGGSNELILNDEDPQAQQKRLCAKVRDEIRDTKNCKEKEENFQKNYKACAHLSLPSNQEVGVYDDLNFEIAECYKAKNDRANYERVLGGISQGEREGPTSCPMEDEAKAKLEAASYPEDTCTKDSDLGTWVGTSIDISVDSLRRMAWKDHPVRFGTWESDDSCLLPMSRFEQTMSKLFNLKVSEIEKTEKGHRTVHFTNDQNQKQLILDFVEDESCLVLDGVYVPQGAAGTI